MKALVTGILALYLALSYSSDFVWVPYKFKPYERYIYDYREVFKEKKSSGGFEIVIERKENNFRVVITGNYGKWSGAVKTDVKNADELSGFVLMRMYFDHHWLIPLGRTILSRGLVRSLTKGNTDWSLGRFEVDKGKIRVVRKCAYGNLEGRMLEILNRGERIFALCASPEASMPIYLYRRDEEGNTFEISLREYSDLK